MWIQFLVHMFSHYLLFCSSGVNPNTPVCRLYQKFCTWGKLFTGEKWKTSTLLRYKRNLQRSFPSSSEKTKTSDRVTFPGYVDIYSVHNFLHEHTGLFCSEDCCHLFYLWVQYTLFTIYKCRSTNKHECIFPFFSSRKKYIKKLKTFNILLQFLLKRICMF